MSIALIIAKIFEHKIKHLIPFLGLIALEILSCHGAGAQTTENFEPVINKETKPPVIVIPNNWYVSVGIGSSKIGFNTDPLLNNIGASSLNISSITADSSSTAYKTFLGYQITPNLGVEAGYFNLGNYNYNAVTSGGTIKGNTRVQGLSLDIIGKGQLTSNINVLATIGTHYDREKSSYDSGNTMVANPYTFSNGLNYKYGIGIEYKLTDLISIRADAEYLHFRNASATNGNANMYSVSLVMPLGHRLSQKTRAIIRDTPEPIVLEREREVIVENPPSKKITLSADSLFGFDKYQLSQKGKDSLDQMILQLNRTEIDSILVAGYADRVGSHEYNLKLSEQRVQAVKNYLVEKMNISKEIITAAGHDGDNPVTRLGECKGVRASPALIACLQPDRRVVVEVIGVKEGI